MKTLAIMSVLCMMMALSLKLSHFGITQTNIAKKEDVKNRYHRRCAYKVNYCNGYSMEKGFDQTQDPDQFGYVGTPRHSVEDIKRWCENYIASIYIREYDMVRHNYDIIKERADQLTKLGYTSDEDLDI